MFRGLLLLARIMTFVLIIVWSPSISEAHEAEQLDSVVAAGSSQIAQAPGSTIHVQLVIDQITCNLQTNKDQGGLFGLNDVDEVYFLVHSENNPGSGSTVRLPGNDDYYPLERGQTRKGILVWEGDLRGGETVAVDVIVREQDNAELFLLPELFVKFAKAAWDLYNNSGCDEKSDEERQACDEANEKVLAQIAVDTKDYVQELGRDGNDTIGVVKAVISNRDGAIQIAYLDPYVPINQFQSIGNNQYTLDGAGSRYDLKVSWHETSGKKVSGLTALSRRIYVDQSFVGSPELGTSENPFRQFQDGANAVSRGGAVIVHPGRYSANGTYSKPMILHVPEGEVVLEGLP